MAKKKTDWTAVSVSMGTKAVMQKTAKRMAVLFVRRKVSVDEAALVCFQQWNDRADIAARLAAPDRPEENEHDKPPHRNSTS